MADEAPDRTWRRVAAFAVAAAALGLSAWAGDLLVPRADGAPAPDATFEAAVARASVADGAAIATAQCGGCHSFVKDGPSLTGPDLYGVVGRPIASVRGFDYSTALAAKGGDWTVARLDRWLADPQAFAPGTTMLIGGIRDRAERAAIVAFLVSLGGPGPVRPPGG